MSAPDPVLCRNCGYVLVDDDGGGWLHLWNGSRVCPATYAEPIAREP